MAESFEQVILRRPLHQELTNNALTFLQIYLKVSSDYITMLREAEKYIG